MALQLFAQLYKVDAEKRIVYGRAVQEVPDHSGEIFDYETSKPYFKEWSAEIAKDSGGKSLGNVRAMHSKIAAGKLSEIDFNDKDKAIDVAAKIVDDNEWNKVLEGVYTGFSIGGEYVGPKKAEKIGDKEVQRYTAKPVELSLVDRPCIPTALFFDVHKAEGVIEKVAFKQVEAPAEVGANDKSEGGDLEVPGEEEDVMKLAAYLRESNKTVGDALKQLKLVDDHQSLVGKRVASPWAPKPLEKKEGEAVPAGEALRKSLWTCARFAELLDSLCMICDSVEYERMYEGDNSPLAKEINAAIVVLGDILSRMVIEEVKEETQKADEAKELPVEKATALALFNSAESIVKRTLAAGKFTDVWDAVTEVVKIGSRNNKEDQKRIDSLHKISIELGAKCMSPKMENAEQSTDLKKMVDAAVSAALDPMQKKLIEQESVIEKMKAMPAPSKTILRVVTKSQEITPLQETEKEVVPVLKGDGTVDDAATAIKKLHASGGAPLIRP